MHARTIAVAVAGLLTLVCVGCATDRQRAGTAPPSQEGRLIAALSGYRLPPTSVPPTRNTDDNVNRAIAGMARVAASQGLTFDGGRANEGLVFVGRQGQGGPMVLALVVYPKNGWVASQDEVYANGLDVPEAQRMRNGFMAALK